jgi:hypothetical protein
MSSMKKDQKREERIDFERVIDIVKKSKGIIDSLSNVELAL